MSNRYFTCLSDWFEEIIRIFHIKSFLKPLYYFIYKNKKNQKLQRIMMKNGIEVLQSFHNCLTQNDIPYTLAFGTLLGAVREHGFIKHDFDIDTWIWCEDFNPNIHNILSNGGFRLVHSFEIENGKWGREETYESKGVHIDVFFIYPPVKDFPYCCDFIAMEYSSFRACMKKYGYVQARRLELPFERGRKMTKFEGIDLYIPANAEKILEFRYGQDYMTPNPKWGIQSHNEHVVVWKEKKGHYTEY